MSFFGSQNQAQPDNKQLGLNDTSMASNEQGSPLPYLAGKRRFAGTFITDAFSQITNSVSSGKDSGKGGGGSGTNYYASFAVAWCIGPCDEFSDLFLNGDAVYTETTPLYPITNGLTVAANLATFQTTNPHGLSSGQSVLITGADQSEINGEFIITVTGANTFTWVIPGAATGNYTASGQIQCWIKLDAITRGSEDSITVTIPNYGTMTLYWGTETQSQDPTLPGSGITHSPMHGVCYSVFKQFFIGLNQTNIQNVEIVLARRPSPVWLPAGQENIQGEANPAAVFYDLLSNPRMGIALTDVDFDIADLQAAALVFFNEGLGLSPIIERSDSGISLIQELCEHIDAIPILNPVNGLLSLLPIRAPASYAGIQVVGDSILADIPKPKAGDWSNCFNDTKIVFPNNQAAWLNDFVEWFDFGANTAAQNVAQPQTIQREWITRRDLALKLVQYAGQLGALPPQTGTIKLLFTPTLWAALPPGALFKLDYSLRPTATGIFRVTKRTLADSGQPVFEIEYTIERAYLYTI